MKQRVTNDLVDDLMGYSLDCRWRIMSAGAAEKWRLGKEGRIIEPNELEIEPRIQNLCKSQSKSMIKFINMQTSLCAGASPRI